MVERRVSWEFLFVALVLTGALMLGMFFMGQALSERKVSTLQKELEQFNQEQNSQELSRQLALNMPEKNCEALNIAVRQTITDVEQLQNRVAAYEESRKLENGGFNLLKKQYMNLLLEYWITTKQVEEACGSDVVKVLYLYEDPDVCPRCGDQGVILTHYRQQYDNRLLVFPLDASLDMRPINLLVDAYNVDNYPTLIIEGDKYEGFKDREAFGNILEGFLQENSTAEGP